ncbi:hypothetical protein OHA02_00135 [Streptomyces phaeochromogenes]|nr:hypothetical protein [Streptomyces phaeochromogenes]
MPAIEPSALSDEQRVLDEHVRRMMDGLRTPFTSTDENGALIGPFPVMLRFPGLARPLLEWFTTVTSGSVLATRVREVAILTIGSRYGAAYELYSLRRPVANGCRGTVTSGTHGLQEHSEAVGMSSRGAAPRRRCCSHRRG